MRIAPGPTVAVRGGWSGRIEQLVIVEGGRETLAVMTPGINHERPRCCRRSTGSEQLTFPPTRDDFRQGACPLLAESPAAAYSTCPPNHSHALHANGSQSVTVEA